MAVRARQVFIPASADRARDFRQRGDVFGIVPIVELVLVGGIDVHGVDQQSAAARGGHGIAGQGLHAVVAQQPLGDFADPFRPDRQIFMGDGFVGGASQHIEAVEFIGRNGVFRVRDADPALAGAETGDAFALRDMFQIVPIVKLVRLRLGIIERDEQ